VAVTSGRILVDDRPIANERRAEIAKRIAVVTQREDLAFPLNVEEYVALGRFPHLGGWRGARAADRAQVAKALERAGVESLARADRRVQELSGGEWQRVRLARALAQGGDALVLDEPTTFLDVAHEMSVFELLHQLTGDGLAILLVSHQLNLVARFADEIVLLHDGRVAAAGTPEDVMQAAILERVYDWPLVVTRDPAVGAPALLPLRVRRRT
jgi:iron complex transport system ATP-binding protein